MKIRPLLSTLIITAVLINTAHAADWVEVARNDKSFVLMDRDSINETKSGTNGVLKGVMFSPYALSAKPNSKVIMLQYSYKANCKNQKISVMKMSEFSDVEGINEIGSVGPFPFSNPLHSIDKVALRSICSARVDALSDGERQPDFVEASSERSAVMLCQPSTDDGSVTFEKTYQIDYLNWTVNDWPADMTDTAINWIESNDHQILALSLSRYSGRITIRSAAKSTPFMSGQCARKEKRLL